MKIAKILAALALAAASSVSFAQEAFTPFASSDTDSEITSLIDSALGAPAGGAAFSDIAGNAAAIYQSGAEHYGLIRQETSDGAAAFIAQTQANPSAAAIVQTNAANSKAGIIQK